jgi:hypothetical protein
MVGTSGKLHEVQFLVYLFENVKIYLEICPHFGKASALDFCRAVQSIEEETSEDIVLIKYIHICMLYLDIFYYTYLSNKYVL